LRVLAADTTRRTPTGRHSRASLSTPSLASFVRFTPPSSIALAALLALCACQPEIGDSCSNASDCSVQEQRTCDTTYPGGYCTVLGCEADTCPEEASCVAFQSVISSAPECSTYQARPRLQRTVCMKTCKNDGDCRGGYDCVDLSLPNPWAATVVEANVSGKVCIQPPPPPPTGDPAVCAPSAPPPLPPAFDAGNDAAP
jgi:hypothetical protein